MRSSPLTFTERRGRALGRRLSAVILLAAASPPADAGCCGPGGAVPTWLDRDERLLVGMDLDVSTTVLRWDAASAVRSSSSGQEALRPRLILGWRPARSLQLGLGVPGIVTRAHTATEAAWGGGLGDVVIQLAADPWTPSAPWVPVLTASVRLPTGLSSAENELIGGDAIGADVTGLDGVTVSAGGRAQGGREVVWRAGAEAGVTVGAGQVGAQFDVDGAVGVQEESWSLMATLRHSERWSDVNSAGARAATTRAGALLTVAGPSVRGWVDGGVDLPVPGLGREAPIGVRFGGGVALLW